MAKTSGKVLEFKKSPASRFQTLFDKAGDAIFIVNNKFCFESVNERFEELTGFSKQDVEGNDVEVLSAQGSGIKSRSTPFGRSVVGQDGLYEDVVMKSKDGSPRFVSISVKNVADGGNEAAICIMRDIGEKKAMERELITKHTELRNACLDLERANSQLKSMQDTLVQSGKLAALGELAAGIAHELNQPLTAIKGFAQEATECVQGNSSGTAMVEVKDYLNEIVKGADKMERIISHLRNFTRKSTEDFQLVNVHDVINEALKMLDQQFRSRGIEVVKNFKEDLPQVYCNPFQLEQVVINLVTNARDAIDMKKEKNGKIAITTSQKNGNMVEIKVADNGVGIPEHLKSKIFNPFFTTKEVGKGMGLGLSISYGILSRINGSVFVESEAGKGAAFTVSLPVDFRKH